MEDGFTFVEVLTVVVVLAILAAIGAAIYPRYLTFSRAAEAPQMLGPVISYCKSYRGAHGIWPPETCHTDNANPFEWIDEVLGEANAYFEYHYDQDQLKVWAQGKSSPFSEEDELVYHLATRQWSATTRLLDIMPD